MSTTPEPRNMEGAADNSVSLDSKRKSRGKNTMAAITAHNQRESPLLRLPGELRNRIYEYALSSFELGIWDSGFGTQIFAYCIPAEGRRYKASFFQALTTTCQQIHGETNLLPVTLNEFCGHPEHLASFLALLHFDASMIQHVRLVIGCLDAELHNGGRFCLSHEYIKDLREFKRWLGPGLKSIVLEKWVDDLDGPWDGQSVSRVLSQTRDIFGYGNGNDSLVVSVELD